MNKNPIRNSINKMDEARSLNRADFIRLSGLAGSAMLLQSFIPRALYNDHYAEINVEGNEVVIPAGTYETASGKVTVKTTTRIPVQLTDIAKAEKESLFLSKDKPSGYWGGTPLQGCRYGSLGVYHSLIESSLTMNDASGKALTKEKDFLVSPDFALVGLGTATTLTDKDQVYASYSYYLQRVDLIAVGKDGVPLLIKGTPALVCPVMPAAPTGTHALCTVYRPISITGLTMEHIFPVIAPAFPVKTGSTAGMIPKTLKKLKEGRPVTIVVWGDSITAESDVPSGKGWPSQLHALLKERFPLAAINFKNHSIGGTRSMQWLHNGSYGNMQKLPADVCSFSLVMNEKPDLVIMEFTNDTVEDPAIYPEHYEMIRKAMQDSGSELMIQTTERFAIYSPEENVHAMKLPETRAYTSFVKDFAARNKFAIADVAARWENFAKEGFPYMAIYINAYNHPNVYGHAVILEEVMKCFGESYQTSLQRHQ